MRALKQLSETHQVPILPSIRQDAEVVKAAKTRKFLVDHAPGSRAVADYNEALKVLMEHLEPARKDQTHSIEAT
jgi:hypothetical protein